MKKALSMALALILMFSVTAPSLVTGAVAEAPPTGIVTPGGLFVDQETGAKYIDYRFSVKNVTAGQVFSFFFVYEMEELEYIGVSNQSALIYATSKSPLNGQQLNYESSELYLQVYTVTTKDKPVTTGETPVYLATFRFKVLDDTLPSIANLAKNLFVKNTSLKDSFGGFEGGGQIITALSGARPLPAGSLTTSEKASDIQPNTVTTIVEQTGYKELDFAELGFDPFSPDVKAEQYIEMFTDDFGDATLPDSSDVISQQEPSPDEIVTIIVELKGAPLGELATADFRLRKNEMYSPNAKTFDTIEKTYFAQLSSAKAGVMAVSPTAILLFDYSAVLNGFSAEVRYGDLDAIRANPLVSAVYICNTYDAPMVPNDNSSVGMISAPYSWDAGYKGDGMLIAVIDTGLDYTHPLLNSLGDVPGKLTKQDMIDRVAAATGTLTGKFVDPNNYSRNEKVIIGYDYADNDSDPQDPLVGHGTHVAGIVAANASAEGIVVSVAPNAQLMAMKVFRSSNGASTDAAILAGIDDAIKLGADSINLSLGAVSGFTVYDLNNNTRFRFVEYFTRARNLGCTVNCSSGNDGRVGTGGQAYMYQNGYSPYDLPYASNPDYGMTGSPGVDANALSVASVENLKAMSIYFTANGTREIQYSDNNATTMAKKYNGQTLDYVSVGGTGRPEDFTGLNLTGKVALISRGDLNFADKGINAAAAGAIAFIVYDNAPGALTNMVLTGCPIPGVFISQADGLAMNANGTGTVVFSTSNQKQFDSPVAGQIAASSSRGPSPDLTLKPEITAPGGNIYSTYPTVISGSNGYTNMSGTSMAAPHVSASNALIKQYVETKYPTYTPAQVNSLVEALMLSTARPITDPNGGIYSVNTQGAGLIDIKGAVTAQAVLRNTVDGKAKLELGDNLSHSGITMSFTAENLSAEAKTFDLKGSILVDKAIALTGEEPGDILYYNTTLTENLGNFSAVSAAGDGSIAGDRLTIAPNGKVTLTVTFAIDEAKHADIMNAFTNGYLVTGYVYLNPIDTLDYALSIPFIGFVGDWSAAPAIESTILNDDVIAYKDVPYYFRNGLVNSPSITGAYLGYNTVAQRIGGREYMALGPNSTSNQVMWAGAPLRNIKQFIAIVRDKDGNVVNYLDDNRTVFSPKSYYVSGSNSLSMYAFNRHTWRGEYYVGEDDPRNFTIVPEGTYTITYYCTLTDGTVQEYSYDVFVDLYKPTAAYEIVQEGDRYLLHFAIADNHNLMMMQLLVDNVAARRMAFGGYQSYSTYEDEENGPVDVTATVLKYGSVEEAKKYMSIFVSDYARNNVNVQLANLPVKPVIVQISTGTYLTAGLPFLFNFDLRGTALDKAVITAQIRKADGTPIEHDHRPLNPNFDTIIVPVMPPAGTYYVDWFIDGVKTNSSQFIVYDYQPGFWAPTLSRNEFGQTVLDINVTPFFQSYQPIEVYYKGEKLEVAPSDKTTFVVDTPFVPGKALELRSVRGMYQFISLSASFKSVVCPGAAVPVVTSVSVTTPGLVETLSGYLNISVQGENLDLGTPTAYLKVGDKLLYPTPITLADGVWKGRMAVTSAPVCGTDCSVVVTTDGYTQYGDCRITLHPYKPADLWSPVLRPDPETGKATIAFSEIIAPKTGGSFAAKVNGVTCAVTQMAEKTLTLDIAYADLPAGKNIVLSGVKYPTLFPSYSFTFTLVP